MADWNNVAVPLPELLKHLRLHRVRHDPRLHVWVQIDRGAPGSPRNWPWSWGAINRGNDLTRLA